MQGHRARFDLARESAVRPQKELLPGLTARVEGARDLGPAEGAGREIPAIVACEGDALGHTLVDDVGAHLGEAVNVRLAGAEISALDRVVEEALDAVPVVRVVLG